MLKDHLLDVIRVAVCSTMSARPTETFFGVSGKGLFYRMRTNFPAKGCRPDELIFVVLKVQLRKEADFHCRCGNYNAFLIYGYP